MNHTLSPGDNPLRTAVQPPKGEQFGVVLVLNPSIRSEVRLFYKCLWWIDSDWQNKPAHPPPPSGSISDIWPDCYFFNSGCNANYTCQSQCGIGWGKIVVMANGLWQDTNSRLIHERNGFCTHNKYTTMTVSENLHGFYFVSPMETPTPTMCLIILSDLCLQ